MSKEFTIQLDQPRIASLTLGKKSTPIGFDPQAPQRTKAIVDTTANWNQKTTYIPTKGEIIVYSDYHVIDGQPYPGIKIGDGLAYVVDLPFVGEEIESGIMDILNDHIRNQDVHVTPEDKEFWNNKLNYMIDGEKLVLTRN